MEGWKYVRGWAESSLTQKLGPWGLLQKADQYGCEVLKNIFFKNKNHRCHHRRCGSLKDKFVKNVPVILTSVAELPLFWAAPAPGRQGPGADSGSSQKKAAPGGSGSIH